MYEPEQREMGSLWRIEPTCDDVRPLAEFFRGVSRSMGERPSSKHTLSRHLDAGDYCPGNVSWGTKVEQVAEAKGKKAMMKVHALHQSSLAIAA